MKQQDYEKMSDRDISSHIIGVIHKGANTEFDIVMRRDATRAVNSGRLDYCNNPSDIMPLVIEAGITSKSPTYNQDSEGEWEVCGSVSDGDDCFCYGAWHKNPYRAAAIVWLMMQGEE